MHVLRDCKDGKFDRSTVKSKTKLKGQTTVDCFQEKGVIELTEQGSSITLENVSFEDCLLERKDIFKKDMCETGCHHHA